MIPYAATIKKPLVGTILLLVVRFGWYHTLTGGTVWEGGLREGTAAVAPDVGLLDTFSNVDERFLVAWSLRVFLGGDETWAELEDSASSGAEEACSRSLFNSSRRYYESR